jgi:sortase B
MLTLTGCSGSATQAPSDAGTNAPPPDSQGETPVRSELEPTDPTIPYDSQIASITPALSSQILEKRKENDDAVGWLIVPGTTINDVVLLNPPRDNNYYTLHNSLGQPDPKGAYGMDYHFDPSVAAARENLYRNMALYAHNLDDDPNGIFFAQLKKYKDPAFAKANPYIFFSTADEDMVWEVFAVFDTTINLPYHFPGAYWYSFSTVLDTVYESSIYDYGVTISEEDRLLTLSTCTFSVPGHEAMPITELNDYRFVVMARLVEPEEQIKKEAAFTVNDAPLPPDETSSLSYITRDYFMLNGFECDNGEMFFEENDSIEPIRYDALMPIGSIKQSNMEEPLNDWDASQLPVGTVIYQDPEYVDVLVADIDGEKIPYIVQSAFDRELHAVRYVHRNSGGIIREITLEADEVDLDESAEQFSQFIDMVNFTPLPDGPDDITQSASGEEIRIGAKNALSTFYQTFFLGTPSSLGKEVLIIKQQDGYYYGDAVLFEGLREAMYALQG